MKLHKVLIILALSLGMLGCSDYSEEEITVYLVRRDVPDWGKEKNKKETVVAIPKKRFLIFRNMNAVYAEGIFLFAGFGLINRDCVLENKNNWCCYDYSVNHTSIYEFHTKVLLTNNNWSKKVRSGEDLACEYGVIEGEWITQKKYHHEDTTAHSIIYSVPYWM